MPVQLPTKFNLIINLKTAQAVGLAIPSAMLDRRTGCSSEGGNARRCCRIVMTVRASVAGEIAA